MRRLADAALLVFPSAWEEPFGLGLIEAMACGRPVVASRIRSAVDSALSSDAARTRDLGGTATTREFTDAVIANLLRGLKGDGPRGFMVHGETTETLESEQDLCSGIESLISGWGS